MRTSFWIGIAVVAGSMMIMAAEGPGDPVPDKGAYSLSYPAYFGNRFTIPRDNPMTREGVYLGRLLFYEPRMSENNTISCGSCHRQKLAFTDGRALSPGVDGKLTTRSAMSLENLLWTRNLFWDGRAPGGLEEQALTPMTNPHEMGQSPAVSAFKLNRTQEYPPVFRSVFGVDSITGDQVVKAITQFERTLISANSPYDRYLQGKYQPTPREARGIALFMTDPQPEKGIRGAGCGHCHGGPKLFIELFHNNGLDSLPMDPGRQAVTGFPEDRGRFRVPSLRNIALTAPYMHDGRFRTLEEVVDHYNGHIVPSATLSPLLQHESNDIGGSRLNLTREEKESLISFLYMLTDSSFITDPRYSDPHLKQT
jgi:cytochrome c peroxidase